MWTQNWRMDLRRVVLVGCTELVGDLEQIWHLWNSPWWRRWNALWEWKMRSLGWFGWESGTNEQNIAALAESYHVICDGYHVTGGRYHVIGDWYHVIGDGYHVIGDWYHELTQITRLISKTKMRFWPPRCASFPHPATRSMFAQVSHYSVCFASTLTKNFGQCSDCRKKCCKKLFAIYPACTLELNLYQT